MATIFLSRERPAPLRAARLAGDGYGRSDEPDWRATVWRDHLRRMDIGGRRVNYVDVGEPREGTLVFVHGLGGSWQNWLENIPRLARDRRVIALDLPGFGRSEMPAGEVTISGYAHTVDQLCERLELGSVAVVGNSMGGFIGAETAIAFPQRVERLVLVSAAGISIVNLRRQPLIAGARVIGFLGVASAARATRALRRPAWTHASLAFVFRHPTRLARDLLWEQLQGTGKPGFVPALDALTSYDFTDRLPEIGCPTLIVWGRNDVLVPVRDADEFERLIPGSRKVLMDDTGHCAMLERPRAFNDCLSDFITEGAGASREQPAAA